jgi:hypothetical protein
MQGESESDGQLNLKLLDHGQGSTITTGILRRQYPQRTCRIQFEFRERASVTPLFELLCKSIVGVWAVRAVDFMTFTQTCL